MIGVYYNVPTSKLKESDIKKYGIETDNADDVLIDSNTLDCLDIEDWDGVNYEYTDELERDDYLYSLMKSDRYNHFLGVLYNGTWDNRTGYKIFDNYIECFDRDYECALYLNDKSRHGKYVILDEYSHDKPMGAGYIVIGLTDKEYESLCNTDWDGKINFANKYYRKG